MRRAFFLLLAACSQSLMPVYEPMAVTKTACTADLQKSGDKIEFSETAAGIVEAHLLRDGAVFAWGRAERVDGGVTQVVVREVGAFTPLCTAMTAPRAAHAAVKLDDGRVFLSGGYASGPTALASTELYDGKFTAGPPLGIAGIQLPKAFHTASLTPLGQVLLFGGERYPTSGSSDPAPSTAVLVFDADQNAYGAIPARTTPQNFPRSRQFAAAIDGGFIIAGGIRDAQHTAVPEAEFFDVQSNRVTVGPSISGTVVAATSVESRRQVAVVAGTLLQVVNENLTLGTPLALTARSTAHAFARGSEVVVVGDGSSELADLAAATVTAGPAIASAAGSCAVRLSSDRLLVVSDRTASILKPTGGVETFSDFSAPRTRATCTLLDDGTVLIAGGVDSAGAALGDAFIFTPPL